MLKVEVTEYKGQLCIRTINPNEKDPNFIPNGDGRIGCVLADTEHRLGISEEALEILRKIPKSPDAIGDVDAFRSARRPVFSWLGNIYQIVHPKGASGSRDYNIDSIPFTIIENDSDLRAMEVIDETEEFNSNNKKRNRSNKKRVSRKTQNRRNK